MVHQPAPYLQAPQRLIGGIERSDEYLRLMGKEGRSRERALSTCALKFSGNMLERAKSPQEQLNGLSVQLMGQLPEFYESTTLLEDASTYEERVQLLKPIVDFVRTLRSVMDKFPGLNAPQLRDFCIHSVINIMQREAVAGFKEEIDMRIVGMQHEIGMSQILWNIEGVEDVIEAESVEDEASGVDLIVTYKGRKLLIDVKSSSFNESVSQAKYKEREAKIGTHRMKGYPVYTGIHYEEFGGGFRISQETVDRCTPRMQQILDDLLTRQTRIAASS